MWDASKIPNPVTTFLSWWDQLPPEVAKHVACQASFVMVPHVFPDILKGADDVPLFRSKLTEPPHGGFDAVGRVLVFAAAVDFTFVNQATRAEWQARADWQRRAADHMDRNGPSEMGRMVRETADRAEFLSGMWEREATRWKELRSRELSVEAMWLYSMHGPLSG